MRVVFAALSLLALGCPAAEYAVVVDARTDLEPGVDFVLVRTESATPDGAWREVAESGAFRGEDFLRGQRVAELDAVSLGPMRLRVSLVDVAGAVVVDREVSIDVRGSTGIVVVLTRRCAGQTCPGPGDDPDATTCANGRCVPPACTDCVTPSCETDSDCSAAPCADVSCAVEACLVRPRDEYCAEGERCDAVRGCVPESGGACTPEGSGCDDGDPCTSDDTCTGGTCGGTSYACTPGACETAECDGEGGCTTTPMPDCCGNGTCDGGETCTTCPADCGTPVRVCDSCRRWDCCVVIGAVTRYDGDCSTCTPCDACGMAASCHTCAHPMGGDCRYDTQECNVRFEDCNCRDECP